MTTHDEILLENLEVACIIGDLPHERQYQQKVVLDLALACDLAKVCASDHLADTVNYVTLVDAIRATLIEKRCKMIEHAAEAVARTCLSDPRVSRVSVTLRKPGALIGVCAGVRITRLQPPDTPEVPHERTP